MAGETMVRAAVEIDAASEPLRGTLDDGTGAPIAFTGWLELMSGFETVCERARQATETEPPPAR